MIEKSSKRIICRPEKTALIARQRIDVTGGPPLDRTSGSPAARRSARVSASHPALPKRRDLKAVLLMFFLIGTFGLSLWIRSRRHRRGRADLHDHRQRRRTTLDGTRHARSRDGDPSRHRTRRYTARGAHRRVGSRTRSALVGPSASVRPRALPPRWSGSTTSASALSPSAKQQPLYPNH